MAGLIVAAMLSIIPIHGVVIQALGDRSAIVRTDPAIGMLAPQIRRYRLEPAIALRPGTGIDGLLDPSTQPATLRDAVVAAPFAPGLPDSGRVIPVELGSGLPAATLVDQDAHVVQLDRSFRHKTLLLSFMFTRCPDRTLCPAISAKFAALQQRLDGKRFALAEITLDPQYDSPAVLRRYGDAYGADARIWKLLTGTGSTIQRVLNAFRISSMRVSTANFLHADKLFVVAPTGRVAYVVDTADWDPSSVEAQARAVAGVANNPFERFKLSLIANVVALCGGSQFAGIALLELSLFAVVTAIAMAALWLVARVLWPKHP
jgi:protein SCO1